jgi:hypothetical protein
MRNFFEGAFTQSRLFGDWFRSVAVFFLFPEACRLSGPCHPERSEALAERSRRTPCFLRVPAAREVFSPLKFAENRARKFVGLVPSGGEEE